MFKKADLSQYKVWYYGVFINITIFSNKPIPSIPKCQYINKIETEYF